MKNENVKGSKVFWGYIGWCLIAVGVLAKSFFVVSFGVVFLIAAKSVGKVKSADDIADIISGANQSMPSNNTHIRSSDDYRRVVTSEKVKPTFDLENPNVCPICKSVSANGYCTQCGYRFK